MTKLSIKNSKPVFSFGKVYALSKVFFLRTLPKLSTGFFMENTPFKTIYVSSTILVGKDKHGEFITHHSCGRRSYNKNDIKYKYCGSCHTFPEDEEFKKQIKRAMGIAERSHVKRYG